MRKRNKNIYIRFSEEEYLALKKKIDEAGLTIQDYILQASLNSTITSKEQIDEWKELNKKFSELVRVYRGIGTNINQLTHIANVNKELPEEQILIETADKVISMRKGADELWQSIRLLISRQNLKQQ